MQIISGSCSHVLSRDRTPHPWTRNLGKVLLEAGQCRCTSYSFERQKRLKHSYWTLFLSQISCDVPISPDISTCTWPVYVNQPWRTDFISPGRNISQRNRTFSTVHQAPFFPTPPGSPGPQSLGVWDDSDSSGQYSISGRPYRKVTSEPPI